MKRIDWTEPAVLDLESIRSFIGRDAEHYAAEFVRKIIEATEKLESFPMIGRPVPEARQENIRELLFHSYRIMYRVEQKRILIICVIHGSRDISLEKPKPWDIV